MSSRAGTKRSISLTPGKGMPRFFHALTRLGLCALTFFFTAGATVSTEVAPEAAQFRNATVFISYPHDDKMELAPLVRENLQRMGFRVVDTKENARVIARFMYNCNWDLGLKLQRFRVFLKDAVTGEKLAGATTQSGFIEKSVRLRLRDVFDAIQTEMSRLAAKDFARKNRDLSLPGVPLSEPVLVAPLRSEALTHTETRLLSDYLRTVLARNGFNKVISNGEMRLYTLEQTDRGNIGSDCDMTCKLAMGRSLSASNLVTGRIQRQGDHLKLDLSLVDVSSGAIRLSVNETIAYSQRLMPAVERAGRQLIHDYSLLKNN